MLQIQDTHYTASSELGVRSRQQNEDREGEEIGNIAAV